MKQIVTMGTAFFLCIALFFILNPLAGSSSSEERGELAKVEENHTNKGTVSGKYVDKIAEFPILPEQRKKLQMIQQQRQESIQGMEPTRIKIPSIGVDAVIQPTGILENGEMGVPENVDEVGWFEPGYKAGAKGHAVLAGHVDSLTGPAIFYDLKLVKPGAQVTLIGDDGREMIFEVKELTSYETAKAPIEAIFGKSNKRMLNLITCTGNYNRDIGSHEERLVVSAELLTDSSLEEKLPEPPSNAIATAFTISWHAVRDDAIIGYRVYEKDTQTGEMKKIQTISLFDRKKVEITADEKKRYFISSVDVDLRESEKVEAKDQQ